MQRTRPAPRPSEDEAPLPLVPLTPLRSLLEEVRAPGAGRADVDALLRGLAGPLAEGESPRERADVLLELLQDALLAGLTGSGSRPMRTAALEALLGLGYPYALEVPPDLLAELRPQTDTPALLRRPSFYVGLALPVLAAAAEFIGVLSLWPSRAPDGDLALIFSLIIFGTTLLPALLAFMGAWGRSPLLNGFGIWPLGLAGLVWLLIAFLLITNGLVPVGLPVFFLGAAHLASAVLLRLPSEEGA